MTRKLGAKERLQCTRRDVIGIAALGGVALASEVTAATAPPAPQRHQGAGYPAWGTQSDIGYLSNELQFHERSALVVRAQQTVFFSGLVSVTQNGDGYRIVGEGDMREQIKWIFEIARRALAAERLTPRHVASYTGYVIGMAKFNDSMDIVRSFFGDWAPCATVVGVAELGWPGLLCEFTFTAIDPTKHSS
jgi:enamine deaminase RidA (YjgF/YER057c/UK114 family)